MNTKFLIVLILFGPLALFGAFGQPAQIIILRHGEKPDDPKALHLSPRGEERARALVALLGRASALTTNAPVAALYATRVTRREHGERTGETLLPLARDLKLPVNTAFGSDDYRRLAARLLHDPSLCGKTVIICWTHHTITSLAAALGVKPAPHPWKQTVFDRLWIIHCLHAPAEMTDVPQRLLVGDSIR